MSDLATSSATPPDPYRTASPAHGPSLPPRPSALAVALAWLLPVWMGAGLQWYRRALGGRWTRLWFAAKGHWVYGGWAQQPTCVASTGSQCGECTKDHCRCEVYP